MPQKTSPKASAIKRLTVAIFDKRLHAMDLDSVLRQAGIDSKIVSKHAVQIHPMQLKQAKEAALAEQNRRKP